MHFGAVALAHMRPRQHFLLAHNYLHIDIIQNNRLSVSAEKFSIGASLIYIYICIKQKVIKV